MDYEAKSLKAQMRRADKLRATHVIILGEDELAKGVAILRNMDASSQEEIPLKEIVEKLLSRFKGRTAKEDVVKLDTPDGEV